MEPVRPIHSLEDHRDGRTTRVRAGSHAENRDPQTGMPRRRDEAAAERLAPVVLYAGLGSV
jgi:hypothetical protein